MSVDLSRPAEQINHRALADQLRSTALPAARWRKAVHVQPLLDAARHLLAIPDADAAVALLQPAATTPPQPTSPINALYAWREWLPIADILNAVVAHEAELSRAEDRMRVRMILGAACEMLADNRAAADHLAIALDLARALGDQHAEVFVLNHQGNIAVHAGELERGIAIHKSGLTIARRIGDADTERAMLNSLGVAYETLALCRQAITYYEGAWKIAQRLNNAPMELLHIMNITSALTYVGDYVVALRFAERMLPTARNAERKDVLSWLLRAQGTSLMALGRYAEAGTALTEAVAAARASGSAYPECDALDSLALLALKTGDSHRARSLIAQAVCLPDITDQPDRYLSTQLTLARADEADGFIEAALAEYARIAHEALQTIPIYTSEAHLLSARIKLTQAKTDEALTHYIEAYATIWQVEHYLLDETVRDLRHMVKTTPTVSDVLLTTPRLSPEQRVALMALLDPDQV